MHCVKCGKETPDSTVFCPECLAVMEQYPVKPGTAVKIPQRPAPKKVTARRKVLSLEEQLPRLQKTIRVQAVVIMVLLATLAASVAMTLRTMEIQEAQANLGKNYNTVTTTEQP